MRSVHLVSPSMTHIAEVLLLSQGFSDSHTLGRNLVSLMEHLHNQVGVIFANVYGDHCCPDIQPSWPSCSFFNSSPQLVVDATLVYTNWKRLYLKLPTISEMASTQLALRMTVPHWNMQPFHIVLYNCTQVEFYHKMRTSYKTLSRVISLPHTKYLMDQTRHLGRMASLQYWWRLCSLSWVTDTCSACLHWWKRYVPK